MPGEETVDPETLVRYLVGRLGAPSFARENSTMWTRVLKESLTELLVSEGKNITEVLFSNPKVHNHEFLLDIVVWDRSAGEGVILAVESEWTQSVASIVEDFWKLLVVKAPVKLMIFALNPNPRKHSQEKVWEAICECFQLYRDHQRGERYVFIDFAPLPAQRAWSVQVQENGRMAVMPDRKFIDLS